MPPVSAREWRRSGGRHGRRNLKEGEVDSDVRAANTQRRDLQRKPERRRGIPTNGCEDPGCSKDLSSRDGRPSPASADVEAGTGEHRRPRVAGRHSLHRDLDARNTVLPGSTAAPAASSKLTCRVAPGDTSPGAPTDPDVRNCRIRLVGAWLRYVAYRCAMRGRGSGKRSSNASMRSQSTYPALERRESHFCQARRTSRWKRSSAGKFDETPKYP